ncbi:MAG: ferrous iron transport protein A [bacterium]|nr:ferrous iron transport protein A [bacterium]
MNAPSSKTPAGRGPGKDSPTLASLLPGESGRIVAVDFERAPGLARLMEIGFIPGQVVEMIKQAPFGDPIEVRVMNSDLVLRKKEADAVLLEAVT